MKLASFAASCALLLALGATAVDAVRMPWLERDGYNPTVDARAGSRTRSALERRSSAEACDPMNVCGSGQCPDNNGCCTTTTTGSRKRSEVDSFFRGDILDPSHAVRFLLSDTGTYTHDNGSIMIDHIYDGNRRRKIAEHARRGLISRMAAQSLTAFVNILPKSYIARAFLSYETLHNKLLVFSPQTAIDMEEIPEIVDLLLEREWDSLTLSALKIEREAVAHLQAVLTGQASVDDDVDV